MSRYRDLSVWQGYILLFNTRLKLCCLFIDDDSRSGSGVDISTSTRFSNLLFHPIVKKYKIIPLFYAKAKLRLKLTVKMLTFQPKPIIHTIVTTQTLAASELCFLSLQFAGLWLVTSLKYCFSIGWWKRHAWFYIRMLRMGIPNLNSH